MESQKPGKENVMSLTLPSWILFKPNILYILLFYYLSEGDKKCFVRDGNVLADAHYYSLTMFFCLIVLTELLDCAPHDYALFY